MLLRGLFHVDVAGVVLVAIAAIVGSVCDVDVGLVIAAVGVLAACGSCCCLRFFVVGFAALLHLLGHLFLLFAF